MEWRTPRHAPAEEHAKQSPPKSMTMMRRVASLPLSLRQGLVSRRYRIKEKLGAGSFGTVYLALDVSTGNLVAVKVEPAKTQHPQLLHEAKILKAMQGVTGFPKLYWYGHLGDCVAMVMERLGPTLDAVFCSWGKRHFPVNLVAMFGIQLVKRLRALHEAGFIHRDVKPENFLLGNSQDSSTTFCVDFGLGKRWRDNNGKHIPFVTGRSLTGTARYASVNAHAGYEPSRRDDLISLGYSLIYFAKGGHLPWQGLRASNKDKKYARIMQKKRSTTLSSLCSGLPTEFTYFLSHVIGLGFDQTPHYDSLLDLLRTVAKTYQNPPLQNLLVDNSRTTNSNESDRKRQRLAFLVRQLEQSPDVNDGAVVDKQRLAKFMSKEKQIAAEKALRGTSPSMNFFQVVHGFFKPSSPKKKNAGGVSESPMCIPCSGRRAGGGAGGAATASDKHT